MPAATTNANQSGHGGGGGGKPGAGSLMASTATASKRGLKSSHHGGALKSQLQGQSQLSNQSQGGSQNGGGPDSAPVIVWDAEGRDVTPRPLLARPAPPQQSQSAAGQPTAGSRSQSQLDLSSKVAAAGAGGSQMLHGALKTQQQPAPGAAADSASSLLDATFQMMGSGLFANQQQQTQHGQQSTNRPRSNSNASAMFGGMGGGAGGDDYGQDVTGGGGSMMSTESGAGVDTTVLNADTLNGKRAQSRGVPGLRAAGAGGVGARTRQQQPVLPEDYLVTLTLQESDTFFMLDVPSLCVGTDLAEEAAVLAANERYQQVKQLHLTSDNYAARGCQTFNEVVKSKDVQATLYAQSTQAVQATSWDIYDANRAMLEALEQRELVGKDAATAVGADGAVVAGLGGEGGADASVAQSTGFGASNAAMSRSYSESIQGPGGQGVAGSTASLANGANGEQQSVADTASVASSDMESTSNNGQSSTQQQQQSAPSGSERTLERLNQERLLAGLRNMEIAVMHNNHLRKLTSFFDLPDVAPVVFEAHEKPVVDELEFLTRGKRNDKKAADLAGSTLPSLQLLWTFKCELTKGRPINFMAWNKKNANILAVAYDEPRLATKMAVKSQQHQQQQHSPGLILVWSLKNLEYPDRIYRVNATVKSLDFSAMNPSLLAAGLNDGNILIFDIRSRANMPVLDTNGTNQHHDPVWDLCWVEHEQIVGEEQSKAESLVSVSTDGRIKEWSMKKGMESVEIMSLKRVSNKQAKGQKADDKAGSFVSRLSGGLCFDFNKFNSKLYVVGTEEGVIHKCSRSYEGQYLDSYYGHHGPVYKVQWSPFASQVFASCGADWTIQVWREHSPEASFKLQSGRVPVNDVCWSPHCSTVMMSVYDDGRIEIWDLSHSLLSPVILHTVLDHRLTRAVFAPGCPSLATGDDNGAVSVYKMRNFKRATVSGVSNDVQVQQLHEILAAKDKKADETGEAAEEAKSENVVHNE